MQLTNVYMHVYVCIYVYIYAHIYGAISLDRERQYGFQNAITLIVGNPKMVPLLFGNMCIYIHTDIHTYRLICDLASVHPQACFVTCRVPFVAL